MARFVFLGTVVPERVMFAVGAPRSLTLKKPDGAAYCTMNVSIECSQVQAVVECADNEDLFTLRNNVVEAVQVLLDASGFLEGHGYDLEITTCTDAHGKLTVFGVGVPCLQETRADRPLSFEDMLNVCTKAQAYRLALADARSAIRHASNSAFYCYRAVESLRHHFALNGEDSYKHRFRQWKRLFKALNIRPTWLDPMRRLRNPRAHGELTGITGEARVDVFKRTWAVLDRFGVLVRDKIEQLPAERFKILR